MRVSAGVGPEHLNIDIMPQYDMGDLVWRYDCMLYPRDIYEVHIKFLSSAMRRSTPDRCSRISFTNLNFEAKRKHDRPPDISLEPENN